MGERVRTQSSWECLEPPRGGSPSQLGIYSDEEFRRILRYERVRSERERGGFSLAVFELNGRHAENGNGAAPPQKLVANLRRTVRLTDHIGWYGCRNVAVLLPGATEDEANRFRDRVAPDLAHVPVRLYCYRDGWSAPQPFHAEPVPAAAPVGSTARGGELTKALARRVPAWKRALDVGVSVAMLFILAPVLLCVGIFVFLSSPGPVIFMQKRVGHGGRIFELYKFRTMVNRPDESVHSRHAGDFIRDGDVAMTKLDDTDPRIIHGGRILRKMALDELPQLLNVLKGDMSLVGPRPCIPYEAEIYARWQTHRFDVLPGITGPWQVNGKNDLSFRAMVRLDITYCRTMSLGLDIRLLAATIPAIAGQVRKAIRSRLRRQ